jgi:hypothetical protein
MKLEWFILLQSSLFDPNRFTEKENVNVFFWRLILGKINQARVILGGLLAGFVMNIGEYILNARILAADWTAAMQDLNRKPFSEPQILWFVIMTFILGIAAVWVYAAIRPRFNPGPGTAICAGLIVWFFLGLYNSFTFHVMGLFPDRLLAIATIWGLFEIPIATVIGAWLYKE